MTDPIKCFMLEPVERASFTRNGASITTTIYRAPDGSRYNAGHGPATLESGEEIPQAPVGAMWDCDWYRGAKHENGTQYDRNPDGLILAVRTPGGDWVIDGPSFSDRKETGMWTRSGTAPNITATPSILMPKYHGWLRDGYLVEVV